MKIHRRWCCLGECWRFSWRGCFCLLLLLGVTGCSASNRIPGYYENVLSLAEIYRQGYNHLQSERYRSAIDSFDRLEQHYPYSSWAAQARLMSAYSHYKLRNCNVVDALIEGLLELYPIDTDLAYARYLRAQCYFEEISDTRIDQEIAWNAYNHFTELVRLYPNTSYALDGAQKARFAYNHLAAREMSVARFYQDKGNHTAAIIRFQDVIEEFPGTEQIPEAIYRQIESYLALGLRSDALYQGGLLNGNYPRSFWTRRAIEVLKNVGVWPDSQVHDWDSDVPDVSFLGDDSDSSSLASLH